MKKIIYTTLLATAVLLSACNEQSDSPNPQNGDELKIEGALENTLWVIENASLPTEYQRSRYDRMEFTVDKDNNYTWAWIAKPGQKSLVFKGDTYYEKSAYEHGSGSAIYNIAVNVQTINDEDLPGGWYGIYTYDDENHMILNVEPDVQSWTKHPTAQEGVGSGQDGQESVYRFIKKES